MALAAAGFTMDGDACRRMSLTALGGHRREVTGHRPDIMEARLRPGPECGLISVAETSRDMPRQVLPLRPGTTAHRTTPCRMAFVNRTEDAKGTAHRTPSAQAARPIGSRAKSPTAPQRARRKTTRQGAVGIAPQERGPAGYPTLKLAGPQFLSSRGASASQ
jgi:hypothetical protein